MHSLILLVVSLLSQSILFVLQHVISTNSSNAKVVFMQHERETVDQSMEESFNMVQNFNHKQALGLDQKFSPSIFSALTHKMNTHWFALHRVMFSKFYYNSCFFQTLITWKTTLKHEPYVVYVSILWFHVYYLWLHIEKFVYDASAPNIFY